jgi:hypothetical protein
VSLTRADLWSLEEYAEQRGEFRARIMQHKKDRQIFLGPHATLHFEDALTMKYQVQEMLRIERIFEAAGIQEELDAYNPLIPDGSNWKATFMIEYADPQERQAALATLTGIENEVWVMVGDGDKPVAIANEDLDRSREDKTAAVHFLRFELSTERIEHLKAGARLSMGIDHQVLDYAIDVQDNSRLSLIDDLL